MDKEPRYLIEVYTDEFRTLQQAIIIDLEEDAESNREAGRFLRRTINPNLTLLIEIEYLNKNHKLIKREMLVKDEWITYD